MSPRPPIPGAPRWLAVSFLKGGGDMAGRRQAGALGSAMGHQRPAEVKATSPSLQDHLCLSCSQQVPGLREGSGTLLPLGSFLGG